MATIKFLSGNSMRGVMDIIAPRFEKETGHKLEAGYDPAQILLERIEKGETTDVLILNGSSIAKLAKAGKVVPDSVRPLYSNGVGVGVKAGAPKPDISTVDAFKRALLAAKTVSWTTHGASGIYFAGLIERLGMAEPLKAKAVCQPGGLVGELVVAGKSELAVQQLPELMSVRGLDLVGPLPKEIQNITAASGGVFAGSKNAAAARAFLDFLTGPEAKQVFKSKGMDPA